MLNILVQLVFLLKVGAFFTDETYRTKGLKVIEIDLDKHNEFVLGESIVTITLEASGQGAFPVLSYCPTDNLQSIKNILSSINSIKGHIESNKQEFLKLQENYVFLIMMLSFSNSNYKNQSSLIHQAKKTNGFTIDSVYLAQRIEKYHFISILQTIAYIQQKQPINNSNNVIMVSDLNHYPHFAFVNHNIILQLVKFKALFQYPKNLYKQFLDKYNQIDIASRSSSLITIPLNKDALQLDVLISSGVSIESMLGCYLEREYLPFTGSLGYDLHNVQKGLIKFYQADIQECNRIYHQINSKLNLQLQPKLILLLHNPQQQDILVSLFADQLTPEIIQDQFDLQLLLISAFIIFWIVLLMFGCLKYIYARKQQIFDPNQNNRIISSIVVGSRHKKQLSLDFIPSNRYEKIIEQYPALKETDCQICLIEFDKNDFVKLTYCLHIFHSSCLDEWRLKNQICPFCRDELTKTKYLENENNNRIYKLGFVENNEFIIDEKKLQEIAKREERLKQLKIQPSGESVNSIQEVSPSPQQNDPLRPK